MLGVYERWVGDRDRLQHIDPKFFWPQQHFFLILAGLLNHRLLRAQAELALTLASCPQLTPTATDCLKPSVAPGYIIVWCPPASCGCTHLLPSLHSTTSTGQGDIPISWPDAPVLLFFRLFTRVHLLIDGLVEGQYVTKGAFWSPLTMVANFTFI